MFTGSQMFSRATGKMIHGLGISLREEGLGCGETKMLELEELGYSSQDHRGVWTPVQIYRCSNSAIDI